MDHAFVGVEVDPVDFGAALECDQRALLDHMERLPIGLLGVVIDAENMQVVIGPVGGQLLQGALLRAADRAPLCKDIDQYGFMVGLRGVERGGGERGLLRGKCG